MRQELKIQNLKSIFFQVLPHFRRFGCKLYVAGILSMTRLDTTEHYYVSWSL